MFTTSWKRYDLEFISGRDICRAWLYRPDISASLPCVVMAHGFGGVRTMRLSAYAERFAAAGYAVLVFDYRHFGSSAGQPRQLLSIRRQLEDWRAAVGAARSCSGVDPQAIVLWGTSLSGGHVIRVAADDPEIAAVISQVPHVNGLATARATGFVQSLRLTAAAFRDVAQAVAGRPPHYVNTVGEPGELAAMTAPGEANGMRRLYGQHSVCERVAARVFLQLAFYSPGRHARRLRVPCLVQVARGDVTTPIRPVIDAIRQTDRGVLLQYQCGHFDPYVPPMFEEVVADQLAFLFSYLPVKTHEKERYEKESCHGDGCGAGGRRCAG